VKFMMFVVVDPDAAAQAEPSEDDLSIDEWLDDVIAIAARHPQANGGKLELRRFWTDED
jgi:hypothetical protein